MRFPRSSGILLHPTSLPGGMGIGELGEEAYRFADFLVDSGQRIWQVLPLGPTGYGDSPYQCFSAFAGNPLLISIDKLVEEGMLTQDDIADAPNFPTDLVDFGYVIHYKTPLLFKAAMRFRQDAPDGERAAFETFCLENGWWLNDYALFIALKAEYLGAVWNKWDRDIVLRRPEAIAHWHDQKADEVFAQKFCQYQFFKQWGALKIYCNERGIRIMGDIPIYVAHDSVDVWANLHLFHLDEDGNPTVVAGVPPDYFSASGQLWGNPIYRWNVLANTGYQWWVARIKAVLSTVDILRIDHFRGFEAYWEIPAEEETAINGHWVTGPGAGLFEAFQANLGPLPIVAENLGLITERVEALRERFEFPGMGVLQFAFGPDIESAGFLPHEYYANMVAYTGTHDNDTTLGWWRATTSNTTETPKQIRQTRAFARKYLNTAGHDFNWVGIRAVMASVADTAIFPLQDILGLDSEARMNAPGTTGGRNWRWRFSHDALTPAIAKHLYELTQLYGRLPSGQSD